MTHASVVTCDTLLEQISAYLDDELSPATCDAIERHASDCPACTAIIDDLRRTTGLCRRAAATPLPPDVRRLARARIRQLITSR